MQALLEERRRSRVDLQPLVHQLAQRLGAALAGQSAGVADRDESGGGGPLLLSALRRECIAAGGDEVQASTQVRWGVCIVCLLPLDRLALLLHGTCSRQPNCQRAVSAHFFSYERPPPSPPLQRYLMALLTAANQHNLRVQTDAGSAAEDQAAGDSLQLQAALAGRQLQLTSPPGSRDVAISAA